MSVPLMRRRRSRRRCRVIVLRCSARTIKVEGDLEEHGICKWRAAIFTPHSDEWRLDCREDGHSTADLFAWINQVTRRHETVILACHNLAHDLQLSGILRLIDSGDITVKWLQLSPKVHGLLHYNSRRFRLLDMAAWCGVNIAAVCEWFGLYGDWTERDESHGQDEYNALELLVQQWLDWSTDCCRGITYESTGRTAFELWRALYAPVDRAALSYTSQKPLLLPAMGQQCGKNCIPRTWIVQPSLYLARTGRVEGPIYEIDIRSFYPSIYLTPGQPTKLALTTDRCSPDHLKRLLNRYWVVADVTLGPSKWRVPIRRGRAAIWDYPPARTVCSGSELDWYVNAGVVRLVHFVCAYERGDYLSEFGAALIAHRDHYDMRGWTAHCAFTKMVAIALWGKLAPRPVSWVSVPDAANLVPWGDWWQHDSNTHESQHMRSIAGQVQCECETGWPNYSWPAAAVFVTAEARWYLNALCERIGEENIIYRIVDGLHINQCGWDRIKSEVRHDGARAGELRLTGVFPSVTYHGLASWEHQTGWRIAGLPDNAVRIETGEYHGTIYSGPAESYAAGNLDTIWTQRRKFSYGRHKVPTGQELSEEINIEDY